MSSYDVSYTILHGLFIRESYYVKDSCAPNHSHPLERDATLHPNTH